MDNRYLQVQCVCQSQLNQLVDFRNPTSTGCLKNCKVIWLILEFKCQMVQLLNLQNQSQLDELQIPDQLVDFLIREWFKLHSNVN